MNSTLLNSIEKAIEENIIVDLKTKYITTKIKPYKIINLQGIWYLIAKNLED